MHTFTLYPAASTNMSRYGTATVGGITMTILLFMVMQALVSSPALYIEPNAFKRYVSTIHVPPEKTQPQRRTLPERIEDPIAPPKPSTPPTHIKGPGGNTFGVAPPEKTITDAPHIGPIGSNEPLAIVKVQPAYPNQAAARGIEGWVLVEYTVTALGTVSDIQILDASPKGVFDRSVKNSLVKWRYQPKEVDGRTMAVSGIKQILTFELKD